MKGFTPISSNQSRVACGVEEVAHPSIVERSAVPGTKVAAFFRKDLRFVTGTPLAGLSISRQLCQHQRKWATLLRRLPYPRSPEKTTDVSFRPSGRVTTGDRAMCADSNRPPRLPHLARGCRGEGPWWYICDRAPPTGIHPHEVVRPRS